jgi:predicted aldo/keto reductase-like oxidoreductase
MSDERRSEPIVTRRRFLQASAAAAAAAHLPLTTSNAQEKTGMRYRRLGRTELKISEVSLGGSPVPPEAVFRRAIELGVNYVDTSSSYMEGNGERLIGKLIKGRRDKFHVATKFHPGRRHKTKEALIEEAEGSLKRLDTDYVDVLLYHGANDTEWLTHDEVLGAFEKLKKDGKARFTGVSCHSNPVEVLTKAIESGHYDMITVGYNAHSGEAPEEGKVYEDYLKFSGIEKVLALAKQKDVGVVAMKTMAGGERQNLKKYQTEGVSLPQAKLKWVLENKAVAAAITEMLSFEILEENLGAIGVKMSDEEREVLNLWRQETSGDYCRMCGACRPVCEQGIAVPDIFRFTAYHDGYDKPLQARAAYRNLPGSRTIKGCNRCGRCEEACPHGLPIVRKLEHAHRLLRA